MSFFKTYFLHFICNIFAFCAQHYKEGDFTKKEKLAKKKTETFTGAYWCLTTAIYLGWSLWTKQWNITYIVWPVAAVLYAAMYGIVKVVMKVD